MEDLAPQLAPDTQTVILEVQNHNWADIIIYVVHDGRRTRLNVVTATKDASLVIPANIIGQVGSLQLVARRVGAYDRYVSQTISVRTGSTIVLTLESDLTRSRTVDQHVARLRNKLEPDPAQPRHLITVRKAGYRFQR